VRTSERANEKGRNEHTNDFLRAFLFIRITCALIHNDEASESARESGAEHFMGHTERFVWKFCIFAHLESIFEAAAAVENYYNGIFR
jgi:hypothetical protein